MADRQGFAKVATVREALKLTGSLIAHLSPSCPPAPLKLVAPRNDGGMQIENPPIGSTAGLWTRQNPQHTI